VSDIHARTTAEVDIRNLTDLVPQGGRASIIFQFADQMEVVQLQPPRDEIVVGRTFPADVRIDIASLSRQHARFGFANGALTVEDLDSRNGTWLGADRIDKRKLRSGDQVRLGELTAVVAISRPGIETIPPAREGEEIIEGALVHSSAMRELYQTVQRVADNELPVLILGETGTGKELVARAVHAMGKRAGNQLGVVNCGAIPENLTESILFGHEKGAFTGADRRNKGVFEQSHGGTVFLDEVGEMPLSAQSSLLRVLETKKVCRLGASVEIDVDVRVIAATHCDADAMVKEGTFRRDLLYRLNAITLQVPPLRERPDEIEPLALFFLQQACSEWGRSVEHIDSAAMELLEGYSWPGNIRQLRNVVERGALLCEGDTFRVRDLPGSIANPQQTADSATPEARGEAGGGDLPFKDQMDAYEARLIAEAIERTAGNQRAAARLLRMPYRTLVRKVKKYGLRFEG
jgi:DNA-binding NtrC family response regulator